MLLPGDAQTSVVGQQSHMFLWRARRGDPLWRPLSWGCPTLTLVLSSGQEPTFSPLRAHARTLRGYPGSWQYQIHVFLPLAPLPLFSLPIAKMGSPILAGTRELPSLG